MPAGEVLSSPENSLRLDTRGLTRVLLWHDPRVSIAILRPIEEMPWPS